MTNLPGAVLFAISCIPLVLSLNCSSNVLYSKQPISSLPCDPRNVQIRLRCQVQSPQQVSITWYRSLGSAETTSELMMNVSPYAISFAAFSGTSVGSLAFIVNADTLGFYWCQADDYSPSSVVPICPLYINASNRCSPEDLNTSDQQCALNISDTSPNLPAECVTTTKVVSSLPTTSSDSLAQSSVITLYNSTPNYSLQTTPSTHSLSSSSTTVPPSESTVNPITSTQSDNTLLFALIGVCAVLGCVACLIVAAILVLCYLTRRGSQKEREEGGSKTPTVVLNSYSENGNTSVRNGHADDSVENGNTFVSNGRVNNMENSVEVVSAPVDLQESGMSFSNPVYEINCACLNNPVVIPPKGLPQFSPTPPIFSDDGDDKDDVTGRRSYYAKPDLSKKRPRSGTASSQGKDTSPPAGLGYDHVTEMNLQESDNQNDVYSIPTPGSVINTAYRSVEHCSDDYDEIRAPPQNKTATTSNDPGYDDPWETLPSAIKRSRESTRSRSTQPTSHLPAPPRSSVIFDDPTYDAPTS